MKMKRKENPEEHSGNVLKDNVPEAKKKAAYMLAKRAMSKNELIEKLAAKGFTHECASFAADSFEKLGVINDAEYAHMLCRNYIRRGYGTFRIKAELFKRGIKREDIESAVGEIEPEDSAVSDYINRRLKGNTDEKELRRISDALRRRGFSWDQIRAGIEKYTRDMEDLDL